jgi:glycosyltransferase involved in cell wall biosynthesis
MHNPRTFVVEPFLIRAENHFIEVACALDRELADSGAEYIIIGNSRLDATVQELLPSAVAVVEQTAFEDLSDGGRSFLKDLHLLDRRFEFQVHDMLIIPTAYENQILAVEAFVKYRGDQAPRVAVVFHQLFPPTAESVELRNPGFRYHWKQRLRAAFGQSSPKISYWTTESTGLNRAYRTLSGRAIGMLPIPFQRIPGFKRRDRQEGQRTTRVGFLGEGRQEKGLHLFLEAAGKLDASDDNFSFFVQLNRPRGYGSRDMEHLEGLLRSAKSSNYIEIREGALEPQRQHEIVSSLDLLVLPYDPFNYCRRLSGLAAEAAVYGTPVLVSSGTWAARAIRDGLLAGSVFRYLRSDPDATTTEIVRCLRRCIGVSRTDGSHHFRETYTAREFLGRIYSYYA